MLWPASIKMRWAVSGVILAGLALGFSGAKPLRAQDKPACEQFEWSIKREQALFGAPGLSQAASGSKFDSTGGGIALELQPHASVAFILPPERKPKAADSLSGVISFANVPKAGLYQITVSAEAWIDVIQNGQAVKSTAHSGKRSCADVRKSVRFELKPGALTIQLSGAAEKAVKLAVLPAE
jgi:hypothetical protein